MLYDPLVGFPSPFSFPISNGNGSQRLHGFLREIGDNWEVENGEFGITVGVRRWWWRQASHFVKTAKRGGRMLNFFFISSVETQRAFVCSL